MDWGMRGQIPSFGNWDLYGEIPVTQCFPTARQQPGLFSHQFYMENAELDLFKIPASPGPSYHHYPMPRRTMSEEWNFQNKVGSFKDLHQRKQSRKVYDENLKKHDQQHRHRHPIHNIHQTRKRAPKAVDEDLYQIPPEFLYQKPRRKVTMCDFWKRCLGLNCIP